MVLSESTITKIQFELLYGSPEYSYVGNCKTGQLLNKMHSNSDSSCCVPNYRFSMHYTYEVTITKNDIVNCKYIVHNRAIMGHIVTELDKPWFQNASTEFIMGKHMLFLHDEGQHAYNDNSYYFEQIIENCDCDSKGNDWQPYNHIFK